MALTGADVGRRVVVRRRLAVPGAGAVFADVLGELVALGAESLTVRRRDGDLVVVDLAAVTAAKLVPPPAPRRVSDRTLEAVAALGWRGLEEEWLGGWLLRAGKGFTGRANSVLPLDPPDRPVDSAVRFVREWYAARGLPPTAQVPLPLASDVDAVLAADGWRAFNPTRVLTATVGDVLAGCPERPDLPPVRHEDMPGPQWLAGYRYRGAVLPEAAVSVLVNAAAPTFVSVPRPDGLLGVGRGVVDEGWLGVTAVTVPEAARRRGVAHHLMRALAEWGHRNGAERVYLQVADDNRPALALYDGLGFTTHHRYHYRRAA